MKNHILCAASVLLLSLQAFSQGVPETDIYLMDVKIKDGSISLGEAVNVTKRAGYENQPYFMPDGKNMLFVVYSDKQADVVKYDYMDKQFQRVTQTKEDEYSPMLTPDEKHFSVVRVEKDSTQRLWQFNLDGSKPQILLDTIKGIGYYEWLDNGRVALCIVTEPMTLKIVNIKTGKSELVAKGAGRAFHKLDANTLLYTTKDTANKVSLLQYHFNTRTSDPFIVNLPHGTEDFIIAPDGTLLTGSGSSLMKFNPKTDKDWVEVKNFKGTPLENFYRMAISPDMKKLALVSFSGKKP